MKSLTTTFLAIMLTFIVGCGSSDTKNMVTVTGTATYQGQQLKDGVIKFLAPNGDFATAVLRPDGTFTMTEVVPGEQKVAFVAGPASSGSSGGTADAPKANPVQVPGKFGDPQTSGVTVTVPEDGGEVTVELK